MWTEFIALLVFLFIFSLLSMALHWIGEAIDYVLSLFGVDDHDSEWW